MPNKISEQIIRFDAPEKISGEAVYVADLSPADMLYCKTVRSAKAYARIKHITIPDLPAGYFTVDKDDIPGKNIVKMIKDDFPFFADGVVQYIGEPILLIVGPDREILDSLVRNVAIEYEDLDPVLSMEQAETVEECEMVRYSFSRGTPEETLSHCSNVVEEEFRSGYQEHIYLEPQGVVARYEQERIVVQASHQCPYYVKPALVQAFGWDESRIQVIQTTTGGAFGGKEEFPSIIAGHAAFAAFKGGKPVSLIYDREEDIVATTKRHPSRIRYRTGIDSSGRVIAAIVDIAIDGGAFEGLSSVVLQRAMFCATGIYEIPHVRVNGKVLKTHTVPNGAFRGFGAPQAFFAVETHFNHCAAAAGEDILSFKAKHMLKKGSPTSTGGSINEDVLMPEIINVAESMSRYREKRNNGGTESSGKRYGIGWSLFFHGCGFTGSGERDKIKAKVKLLRHSDLRTEILISSTEMGQGPQTTLRKVVAGILNIPPDQVIYDNPDTDRVPDSGPTVASRTAMIVGYLVQQAAEKLKERWAEPGEIEVETNYTQPPHVTWDQDTFQGDAYPAYSWGVNVAEVEVDSATLETEITGFYGVYDVGVALDESIVRGQLEGGIAQGIGLATIEVMEQSGGALMQKTMTDYMIPTSKDLSRIEIELVDNPYSYGAFGAKSTGELPLVGAIPAVVAAVENALGRQLYQVPLKPEYLQKVCCDED